MADNKDKRGWQDRSKISTAEDYELNYWAKKFSVDKSRLLEVIGQLKTNGVKKITEFFKNNPK